MGVALAVEKSPEAFRTISEVAVDLDVPQHVLRFWETKFPHVKPLKRAGGRRYYRPEDLDLFLVTDDVDEAVRHIDAAYERRDHKPPVATGSEHIGSDEL